MIEQCQNCTHYKIDKPNKWGFCYLSPPTVHIETRGNTPEFHSTRPTVYPDDKGCASFNKKP